MLLLATVFSEIGQNTDCGTSTDCTTFTQAVTDCFDQLLHFRSRDGKGFLACHMQGRDDSRAWHSSSTL